MHVMSREEGGRTVASGTSWCVAFANKASKSRAGSREGMFGFGLAMVSLVFVFLIDLVVSRLTLDGSHDWDV